VVTVNEFSNVSGFLHGDTEEAKTTHLPA
jgi:hypothetical protein